MVPTTSRTTTDTNTIRILIWYWTTKTLTFYFELIMEYTISPDRRTVSISFTPHQVAILMFLLGGVHTKDDIAHAFSGDTPDEFVDATYKFNAEIKESLKWFCDKHLVYKNNHEDPK